MFFGMTCGNSFYLSLVAVLLVLQLPADTPGSCQQGLNTL